MTPAEQAEALMLLQHMDLKPDHIHTTPGSIMATFDRIEANAAAHQHDMERWQ